MLLNYKEWKPTLKKGAWVAQGATVIGRTTIGEDGNNITGINFGNFGTVVSVH